MKTHTLSKSTLIRSIQCQKSLFLYKNFYHLRDKLDEETRRRFSRGHNIGLLARSLFPGGRDMSPPNAYSYDQSVKATQVLVEKQFPVIYEAAFRHSGITVALDMLVCKEGKWYAYEVKSSVRISPTYIQDAATQYHVITKSGLPLSGFFLVTINSNYERNGELDIHSLFKITNIDKEIREKLPFVEEAIEKAIHTISQDSMPEVSIGMHCYKPYSCDFMGHCWNEVPKGSIFESAAFSLLEKFTFYNDGIKLPAEIGEDFPLHPRQRTLLRSELNSEPFVEKDKLQEFFGKIKYPLCCFDLEAAQHAIPPYPGTRPYQALPFQYSVLVLNSPDEKPVRKDYLAPCGVDARLEFVEKFLEDTEGVETILVFNNLLEGGQLRSLAHMFVLYAPQLQDRLAKIIDMEIPFKELWYYHPEQRGGYSMKALLPVLAPHLRYDNLEIRDGFEAMSLYETLADMPPNDREKWKNALIDYCHMDTSGLLEIFKALQKMV